MAVGLSGDLPEMFPVAGVRWGTACAGIKKAGRRDLVVMALEENVSCAAVFTRNAFCAAPVVVAKKHLVKTTPKLLVINTSNANAGTREPGMQDALTVCESLAKLHGYHPDEILPFSTGIIGEPLPVLKIISALPVAHSKLSITGWDDAAFGILTTDTVPKGVSKRVEVNGHTVTITGIAKGAGMIRPDMATLLAFIATDAGFSDELLQECLSQSVDHSFNSVTVDGDTSTNDSCVLVATGLSTLPKLTTKNEAYNEVSEAITSVCEQLAQAIIRDGEGATKFITVEVIGGASKEECREVAYTVAHSPLVKTAFFAGDPNWGRILAAVGRSGISGLDISKLTIHLGEVCIVKDGGRAPEYSEAAGQAVMNQSEITVRIDLGRGTSSARIWTCDFSYDYVKINAEYRT